MNPSAPHPHRRRLTRAEVRRRRRNRAIRRVAGLTVMLCVAVGGVSFLLTRHAVVPSASAASAISMPAQSIADSTVSSAENTAAPANALGLTADEARAMLADPLMVLVNHTNKMPDNYTFDTKECGSQTAVNKTLQTAACDAFLEMQKAAAADGVTVWMQSGYRSVKYQTGLYERKTKYYTDRGYDTATAKEMAAAVVNPPGYSEHNCGLAAAPNTPGWTRALRTPRPSAGCASTRWSTALSCATPRGPRIRPRSPTSRGTGGMWAGRTPPRSAPAACASRITSPSCTPLGAERQSAGKDP